MDRGLRKFQVTHLPTNPIPLSLGSLNSFPFLSLSSLLFSPSLQLVFPRSSLCCGAAKRPSPAFGEQAGERRGEERRGEERRGEERRGGLPLEGQRSLSFESYFIFSLATHSSGSHKSAGGLRTAFSRAGGGLAQHNQRRITGRGRRRRREVAEDVAIEKRTWEKKTATEGKVWGGRRRRGSECTRRAVECCSAVTLLLTASFGKWEILSTALAGDH